jgi:nucleoside-diphosphate-sugar epimerase
MKLKRQIIVTPDKKLNSMQTILGASGAIGIELAKNLSKYTNKIRLVSRNPAKVNSTDELFPADLTNALQVEKAIEGSEVVYLVVGFEYNIKIWREKWPPLMKNVIDSCKKHNAKLVFFDNVYMYDRDHISHMTEDTPVRPTSKKGKIREQIAQMLLTEVEKGNLTALIARSADFFGLKNSVLIELVAKNLLKGKKANWFARVDKIHNFTFVPDAAKATAILGNTPDAFNQVWHLPSDETPLTGKQWIELFAKELNVEPKYTVLPIWMFNIIGIAMPVMKEFKEMAYQYDRDYFFDSSKFEKRFKFKPISPEEEVKLVVWDLKNKQ